VRKKEGGRRDGCVFLAVVAGRPGATCQQIAFGETDKRMGVILVRAYGELGARWKGEVAVGRGETSVGIECELLRTPARVWHEELVQSSERSVTIATQHR